MICNLITWIVIGGMAGWLASIVMKTNKKQGLIADIAVGIIGGFLGGFIFGILGIDGGVDGFNIGSLVVAFVGSVIFLYLLRFLRR
jgi:uncharacterized membrane protein YeaQ/YmgE (transglycosylase-associated protein family)